MYSPLKFFNPPYLFELRPYTYPNTLKLMLAFFVLMIVIGLGLKIWQKIKKLEKYQTKLLQKYFSFLVVLGALGVLLTWLRYERVHILAGRFWLALWLLIATIWLYKIVHYQIKVVPQAQKQAEQRKMFQKYLPKK